MTRGSSQTRTRLKEETPTHPAYPSMINAALCIPLVASAGDLEPGAPPGATMKTLDEIPPTWSQRLDSTNGGTNPLNFGCGSDRFECIWTHGSPVPLPTAVLDKETGLVWDRSPGSLVGPWWFAVANCHIKEAGGRRGWSLPTVEEAASLVDSSQTTPELSEGHPFLNLPNGGNAPVWTQTTDPMNPDLAWVVNFTDGQIVSFSKDISKYFWRVRGGHGNGGI